MHVLIVSHHALPHLGGVEIYVDLEIRALVEAGHRVTLVTSDEGGAGSAPVYSDAVAIVRLPTWNGLETRRELAYPIPYPTWIAALWRITRDVDAVHAHGAIFGASVLAIAIASLRRKPRMITDHGGVRRHGGPITTWAVRAAFSTLGRVTCLLAHRIVVQNERIARDIATLIRGRRKMAIALPPPVDRSVFRPYHEPRDRTSVRERLGWAPDRPKVLFVGRLIGDKGVRALLDAADPSYDLVFCGPGDRALIETTHAGAVEYLPPRPQHDLADLYRAADVVALPSTMREGGPLELTFTVREALLTGTPVVACNLHEDATNIPGLYSTTPDADALRAAISAALKASPVVPDDSLTQRLAGDRRAWIESAYGPLLSRARRHKEER